MKNPLNFRVLLISMFSGTAMWAAGAGNSSNGLLPADGTVCVYEQSIENLWVDESDESRFILRTFSCTVAGDETIDGHVYKKILYKNMSQNLPEELSVPESEIVYVTEKDGKILRHAGTDYPLIDFSMKAGAGFAFINIDDMEAVDTEYRIVKADDRIKVNGLTYRRLTIADAAGNTTDYWVEGIGSANSEYIGRSYSKPSNGYIESEPKLMSVYNGDNELIFEYSDFATSDKVASVGEDAVIDEAADGSGRIFDVLGRELQTIPQNGIYIVDGKKHVIK